MRGISCSLLLLLAACSTPQRGIEVRTVSVPVVSTEKCIKKGDIPDRPKSLASEGLPPDTETALARALAKVSEWTRFGNKVDIIVSACAK